MGAFFSGVGRIRLLETLRTRVVAYRVHPFPVGAAAAVLGQDVMMSETMRIKETAAIRAPAEVLFGRLADYRSAQHLIDGLESMSPADTVTSGAGARFAAVMRVGPRTFRAMIAITEYEPPHRLTWASSGREGQALTFSLTAVGADGAPATEVTLEVCYQRPGGFTGIVVGPVVEQAVRTKVHSTLERLRADASSAADRPEPRAPGEGH
jgi:uncharacterized membrane protein